MTPYSGSSPFGAVMHSDDFSSHWGILLSPFSFVIFVTNNVSVISDLSHFAQLLPVFNYMLVSMYLTRKSCHF